MTDPEQFRAMSDKLDRMSDRSEERHTELCQRIAKLEKGADHMEKQMATLHSVELKGAGRDAREMQRETTFDNWRSVAAVLISVAALAYSVWRNGGPT